MRRVFALAALTLAASCGGGPKSPTVSTPVPALPSGAYVLSVSIGGGGGQFTACVGSPGLDTGALAANVELQHTGNTVTIHTDDPTATFRMDLQMSGVTLSGTAAGQFLSTGGLVTVGGLKGESVSAVGTAGSSGVAGNLTGNISASATSGTVGPGGVVITDSLGCNSGNWAVTPR